MAMVILTLNCGSSSAKYQVYDWDQKEVLANGVVERIGIEGSPTRPRATRPKSKAPALPTKRQSSLSLRQSRTRKSA